MGDSCVFAQVASIWFADSSHICFIWGQVAACESAVFDIFVIALWISYVSALRRFICFCHSSQLFYSDTTWNKQTRTIFSNRTSSPQKRIDCRFVLSGGVLQRWADVFCFVFISFGGKTLYIMGIGKRLGTTQHVIWTGGSSCHFILAVAGSHAK